MKDKQKKLVIRTLLANGTYTADSKTYQNLEHALSKLSFSNLSNLRLLTRIREDRRCTKNYDLGVEVGRELGVNSILREYTCVRNIANTND